jgi:predicted GNAT family acetyltransferase
MADNLTTATIDVRANTRGLEKDILKALQTVELSQINTKKSSQALGRITGQVSEFNKSLEASNARVVAFGASAGAIFAVEKALSSLISSTIDVQKQLTDINVLLNLSSSSLEKFGGSLFDIARNTAQSFSTVAQAATELSRQGLGVEETLKRTNAALILTRLSGLDANASVETLTATLNSFSGSALDAVDVVNKLANVDAAFAVSSGDLANAISRVGSTAQDAGVSLDELIALVTSAQQTTARGGAVIGNSFKTIFTRLQRGKVQDLLKNLGIDTGEGQSAISLLQQLASTYDTLGAAQKSAVAEQVGGVFQINILKAALADLGKEYSVYGQALQTSLGSTDQAIRRNELLNKTVSALSSQTVASLEEAANKIGTIVFEPNAKGFLSGFNNLLESFNNIDSESAGGKLMEGFFKGVSNFIGGPGAVLATAVLVKLFARLGQFAAGSAKELLGTNKAAQQQAAIEQSILSILQKNSQFTSQILAGKMTTVQAEKQMLDYLTAQSNILREQERLSKVIGANLAMKGVSVGASGIPMTAPAKKTKVAASGYIPNFATDMAVGQAMENAGARQHGYTAGRAKKTTIHDGNGKSFKSFVNNKEDVRTFTNAAGKKATIVRPPNGFGENTQYAAGGFVPNFVEKYTIPAGTIKKKRSGKDSQASLIADADIDEYPDVTYDVIRAGTKEDFNREFFNQVANLNSGDKKAIEYFKKGGMPKYQIDQLVKNASAFQASDIKTKRIDNPVPLLKTDKSQPDKTVPFSYQLDRVKNNVIGKEGYEKFASKQTGIPRASVSNSRMDLYDPKSKKFGEVKFGELKTDNLLAKAIAQSALNYSGVEDIWHDGNPQRIPIQSGFKLVIPQETKNKKITSYASGFIPNFAKKLLGEGQFAKFYSLSLSNRPDIAGVKKFKQKDNLDKESASYQNIAEEYAISKFLSENTIVKGITAPKVLGSLERSIKARRIGKQVISDPLASAAIGESGSEDLGWVMEKVLAKKGVGIRDLHGGNYTLNNRGVKFAKKNILDQKDPNYPGVEGYFNKFANGGGLANILDPGMFYTSNPEIKSKIQDLSTIKKTQANNYAKGFIPNFASMGSKFKAMYGGGTTMRTVDKEKAAKKKNLDIEKLDLSDDYTVVHGGEKGLDPVDVSLEVGNKLFDAKIQTAGLDTAGTNLQRYGIKGVVGDALVGATNNIIKTFGGKEQITDASSLDNAGSVGSAAGTVFETALRKAFNAPAVSQTQRIDFPAPTPELKKFFHNAPGQYEAKIARTPDNLKSALKKWVAVKGLASSSSSGFVPNFAKKSRLSFSKNKEDEFGFTSFQAVMAGEEVGRFQTSKDGDGMIRVGDISVDKSNRGKGISGELYKEAIKRNSGKKMKGKLLPQMNRLLEKIKKGEPVSAETLYPQIKRADLAKDSVFEVYGHKGFDFEKMTRNQFSSFVNRKINELKNDPKKLQSYFGNVEADEYGGLTVDLQTQHSSGFVPNFANFSNQKIVRGIKGRSGGSAYDAAEQATSGATTFSKMSSAEEDDIVMTLLGSNFAFGGPSSLAIAGKSTAETHSKLFSGFTRPEMQLDRLVQGKLSGRAINVPYGNLGKMARNIFSRTGNLPDYKRLLSKMANQSNAIAMDLYSGDDKEIPILTNKLRPILQANINKGGKLKGLTTTAPDYDGDSKYFSPFALGSKPEDFIKDYSIEPAFSGNDVYDLSSINPSNQYVSKFARSVGKLKVGTFKKWSDPEVQAKMKALRAAGIPVELARSVGKPKKFPSAASFSSSGFVPNFAKSSGLSFSQIKDEFGVNTLNALMGGEKVGKFEWEEGKKGVMDIVGVDVNKSARGMGVASSLYKEAIKRNAGAKMRGQLTPQIERLIEKLKAGQAAGAETLYPQIKRADLAKDAVFEVFSSSAKGISKMNRRQFTEFINDKINKLKNNPDALRSYFDDIEAVRGNGISASLETQHASGFVPNFLDVKKDGSLPFGVRGRANFSKPGSKPSIQLGVGATPDTLFHEASHLAYSKATMSKANSNESVGRFISDPKKYAGVQSIMASSIFKNVNQNELFKSLGLNPVQLDFDGKNPGAKYSGAKAVDEITTRIQEKIFKNKGDLASLSANENAFIKNVEGLGIISNKRMSNVSRRSAEGSKFRSLIEGRFSSAMGGAADGFIPNFANTGLVGKAKAFGGAAMKAGLVDVLIEQLMGNAFDGIINVNEMAMMAKGMRDLAGPALAEFQQRAREFLKNKKVKFDQKINPSDLTKTFGKNFSLPRPVPPPGFYGSGSASFASGGFIPNFSNALNDAIAREQSSGLSKSQIYVDSHSSLKNKNNPMGLMVANRRDEPGGGIQGINRAKKEGRNPKTYGGGMSSGFVPNFAFEREEDIVELKGIKNALSEVEKKIKESANDFLNSGIGKTIRGAQQEKTQLNDQLKKGVTSPEIEKTKSEIAVAKQLASEARKTGNKADAGAAKKILEDEGRKLSEQQKALEAKIKERIKSLDDEIKSSKGSFGAYKEEQSTLKKQQAELSSSKNLKQKEMSLTGRAKKFIGSNSMSLGFGLQSAAQMAAEYAGNDDTKMGRGIKAGAGVFGDIASFAGTGAMIAGPYGALAGGLVGAAKGAIDMHRALTTKVPDMEKALQTSSDSMSRFSESGQKLLTLNEQYGEALMSGNPTQAADIMVKTQQAYAEELSKLTEAQRSSMISAIAQGKGQEEYAKILGEMQNSVKAQETATQLTKFSESGGPFGGPDKKLLAGMDKGLALDFTKGMDTASVTAALEKSAASLSDMNRGTENQALDLMKNLASSGSLTGDQKENLNKMIEAFSNAAENTDLSSVAEGFIKSIKEKPKSDADVKKAQQAAKTELEARAAKAKKEIEIREKTNAMLIKLQSDTEAVYQRYSNSMEDFISSIQTASEMMGAAGQFREEYLSQGGANKNITDPIKEKNIVNKKNADLKVGIYKSQLDTSKNFNEGVNTLLSGLEADSAKAAVGQSPRDQSSQFLEMKSKLEQALLPVQEMITAGNYEGAKSKTKEVFNNLKPEERTAIGEDKITSAVKQLNSGIDQGARSQDLLVKNSQKDLAIQAQQLIFQKALAKLTQAQNFGGTTNQILGDTEDSPFNKAIEAVTSAKIMGYNQAGLKQGKQSAVEGGDRESWGVNGKKPSIGTAEQIVNFYKAASEIGGQSVISTDSKDFAVLTQAIREQTRKKLDELRGAGEGVVDPAVFTRLETTLATLGGGDQVAQLKLMKELGFANISGKKIQDEALKGYTGGAFEGLNPDLKKAFENTSDEGASTTLLLLADQQKQTQSILQGQTAQTDSLVSGLEAIAATGYGTNEMLSQQPSQIAQAIGAILEKGRAEQTLSEQGVKANDLNKEYTDTSNKIQDNIKLINKAENKKSAAETELSKLNITESDVKNGNLKKAGEIAGMSKDQYIKKNLPKLESSTSLGGGGVTSLKIASPEQLEAAKKKKAELESEYDKAISLLNASELSKTIQEQSSVINDKKTQNESYSKNQQETVTKQNESAAKIKVAQEDLFKKTTEANIKKAQTMPVAGAAGKQYIDKNEAARQEAAKKKAIEENLAMQGGGDLANEQQKKNRARSQGRELTFNKFSGKMDTFESTAILESGGANRKSFDKLMSQQTLPSFEKFSKIYEEDAGKGKGKEFYQQKRAELLGADKAVNKPTSPAATTPESVTQGTAAAMDLEKRKKSEMDSLMQKYTEYGSDGKMTFNPRNGFASEDKQKAFNEEVAKLRKTQSSYTLENVGAGSLNTQGVTTRTQEPAAAQKTKQEEQKKPEAEKAQDPSQLISNILTTVNQIAAELQKQVNPAAATGGQAGAGGAVSVSTPVNLSINSTAGENKTEVANVADKIKSNLTAFLSSPEFTDRVTTIAKTAMGNPPPPKSIV